MIPLAENAVLQALEVVAFDADARIVARPPSLEAMHDTILEVTFLRENSSLAVPEIESTSVVEFVRSDEDALEVKLARNPVLLPMHIGRLLLHSAVVVISQRIQAEMAALSITFAKVSMTAAPSVGFAIRGVRAD